MEIDGLLNDIYDGRVSYCLCGHVMKPMITFFGEKVPATFTRAIATDIPKCDLILVIGTSLKVGGSVHKILSDADINIPQILINREPVFLPKTVSKGFDAMILGDCDNISRYLSNSLGWPNNISDSEASRNLANSLTCERVDDKTFRVTQSPGDSVGASCDSCQSESKKLKI